MTGYHDSCQLGQLQSDCGAGDLFLFHEVSVQISAVQKQWINFYIIVKMDFFIGFSSSFLDGT